MNLARVLVILASASVGQARLNERGLAKDGFPRDGQCDFEVNEFGPISPNNCGFPVCVGGSLPGKFLNLAAWKCGDVDNTLQCMSGKGFTRKDELISETRVRTTTTGHGGFTIDEGDSVDPNGDVPPFLVSDKNPRSPLGLYYMRGGVKIAESDVGDCVPCGEQCWNCSPAEIKVLRGNFIDLCAALGATPNECTILETKKDCRKNNRCYWEADECIYDKVW